MSIRGIGAGLVAAVVSVVAASPAAGQIVAPDMFRQAFGPVTVQYVSPGADPVDFFGLEFDSGDTIFTLETSDEGVSNPLYEELSPLRHSPLYEGGDRGAGAALISQIESIMFEFGPVVEGLHAEGIVHRDVAARNFVLTTDSGVYSSEAGMEALFSVDAPDDYFGSGAVTWTTVDPIRMYLNGDSESGEYFQFNGTWFTDTPIPAPGAAGLFGLGALVAGRRRRAG